MCVPASRRFDTANFPWTLVLRSSKVWRFYFCMYLGHIAFNQHPKRLNSNGLFCCTVRFAGDMKVCITLSFCSYAVINVTVTRVSWESEWRQLFDGLTRVWHITGIQTKCAYEALLEVRKVTHRLWYYLLHQEWGSCIPAECGAAGREWCPSGPSGSSRTARGSSSQTEACGSTCDTNRILISVIALLVLG